MGLEKTNTSVHGRARNDPGLLGVASCMSVALIWPIRISNPPFFVQASEHKGPRVAWVLIVFIPACTP